jgi:hypothetical protein
VLPETAGDPSKQAASPSNARKRKQSIFFGNQAQPLSDEEENMALNMADPCYSNIQDQDASTIIKSLINRSRFSYTLKDMIAYYVKCVPCRSKKSLKMRNDLTKHYKFIKGEGKLVKKLDIVSLVKAIRQLELISFALLDERQNFMLKF